MKNPLLKYFEGPRAKTRAEVATIAGVSQPHIYKWQRDEHPDIKLSALRGLHLATGIPYHDLVEYFWHVIQRDAAKNRRKP